MAAEVKQRPEMRATTGQSASAELRYMIFGADSEGAALTALEAATGELYVLNGKTLSRQSVSVDPVSDPELSEIWEGTVNYAKPERASVTRETGESVFSFDTGGGTEKIMQSKAVTSRYGIAGYAKEVPDFGGAINVTGDGADMSVDGVDIVTPVYNFNETHYIAYDDVDDAYKQALFGLTGKVNSGTFRGFAAGEVLFLGASGTVRGDDEDWEISFKFSAQQNKTNITIGEITGIEKKGWQYIWARYEKKENNDAIVSSPVAVYVETVYDSGDFDDLGI